MNISKNVLFATAALLTFTANSFAQEAKITKGFDWDRDFGNWLAGAEFEAGASVSREDRRTRVAYVPAVVAGGGLRKFGPPTLIPVIRKDYLKTEASASAKVTVFGVTRTMGSAYARAMVLQGVGTNRSNYKSGTSNIDRVEATMNLVVFGMTFMDSTVKQTGPVGGNLSQRFYGFNAHHTFWVSVVPVTVTATAYGEFNAFGNTVLDAGDTNPTASLTGSINAVGVATASAGVGVKGFSAGVEAALTMLHTTVSLTGGVNRQSIGGRLDITVVPLSVSMSIYAECIGRWTKRVTGWSTRALNLSWFLE